MNNTKFPGWLFFCVHMTSNLPLIHYFAVLQKRNTLLISFLIFSVFNLLILKRSLTCIKKNDLYKKDNLLEVITTKHNTDNIFANIMDISFYCSNNHCPNITYLLTNRKEIILTLLMFVTVLNYKIQVNEISFSEKKLFSS